MYYSALHFFDQTQQLLLFFTTGFCAATILGRRLFLGRTSVIAGYGTYEYTVTIVSVSSKRNFSVLL